MCVAHQLVVLVPHPVVEYARHFLFSKNFLNLVFQNPEERLSVFAATMSTGQEPVFPEYETDTSQTSKLLRKFKETPFVPIGKFKGEEMCVGDQYSQHVLCSLIACEQEITSCCRFSVW